MSRDFLKQFLLFCIPLVVAGGVVFYVLPNPKTDNKVREVNEPTPVIVEVEFTQYETMDDLIAASDLIVMAEASEINTGRILTDPSNTQAGIRTELITLDSTEIYKGESQESIVVEQESELLDGTPLRIENFEPVLVGEKGIYFLTKGSSQAEPYYIINGPQARYTIENNQLVQTNLNPQTEFHLQDLDDFRRWRLGDALAMRVSFLGKGGSGQSMAL